MNATLTTRRDFLTDVARAAAARGLVLHLPWLATLAGCAQEKDSFVHLTSGEARTMRAFAAQIIPSDDDTAGADDAGAVHFVDRALELPLFAESVPVIRAGLADLDARARAVDGRGGFATLSLAHQTAILRQIEHDPFFATARTLVVIGTFANPSYGGNRNGSGWMMVGMEHHPTYSTPFGWYDAQSGTHSTGRAP
jgi:gluconate 2-dehydrogenase gamma chain